ncbi:MAG: hypothetical protein ACK559_01360, partial [bacterium]
VYLADFRRFNFPDYDTLVFGDLLSLLRGFPLSLVPFQLIKPPNVQDSTFKYTILFLASLSDQFNPLGMHDQRLSGTA